MRRYLIILAVVICAAASCTKEEILNTEVKLVPATIVAESSDFETKTTATWNSEESKYNIKWEAGDELSVFTGVDTENYKFTARQTAKLTNFIGELPEAAKGQKIYPIMPFDKDARFDGTTTVYTSVPAEQDGDFYNVVLAGWPRPNTKSEEDFFYQFEAVSGILKFSFDPEKIAKYEGEMQHIVQISITADRPIAGDAKISFAGDKPVMTACPNQTASNQYNTITLVASDRENGFTKGDYYIATLPIIKSEAIPSLGFSVKLVTKEGKVAYVKTSLPGKGKEHIFTANIVKNIGTVKTSDYVLNNGEFTVQVDNGNPKKVSFSPGNLQYCASDNLFRFAPNQYDAIGELGNLTSPASMDDDGIRATQSEWIDLFPFGHSGCTYNGKTFEPYTAIAKDIYYYNYSNNVYKDLVGDYAQGDWGVHNHIQNGNVVDDPGTWRLLTFAEFQLMCGLNGNRDNYVKTVTYKYGQWDSQKVTAKMYFLRCGIRTGVFDGTNEIIRYGILLFPDFFEWPDNDLPLPTSKSSPYLWFNYPYVDNGNAPKYTLSEFSVLEREGVVFLPCAGQRIAADKDNNIVSFREGSDPYQDQSSFNIEGHYWTTSHTNVMVTRPANALISESFGSTLAKSVRLVKNGYGF